MDHANRQRLMFFATLALFAGAAFFAWRTNETVFANAGRLQVEERDGAVVMIWRSDVAAPMARRIEEAYEEWKGRAGRFVLDLNSPGGALAEGRQVIEVLQRLKSTHALETRVRSRRHCLSMCVPIFLQGDVRVAALDSRFMFHEPSAYDFYTEEKIERPAFEQRMESDRFFRRYFETTDMNPAWGEKLKEDWRGRDIWKSGADLVAEDSRIVTVLE